MAQLLYLVHRLPFPPNKGDKVRSFHLLKHLAARHDIFLGTFVDDPDDEQHLPAVRAFCADMHVARLDPKLAKLRSAMGLLNGNALTLEYYRDRALADWVRKFDGSRTIDATVVFSSAMMQYAELKPGTPLLIDFVDVDSFKWAQYAQSRRWPLSWVYRRESERLLAYERRSAAKAHKSFFVTEKETELFRSLAPECGAGVEAVGNGVDADFFSPDANRPSPFANDAEPSVVFTGAMDYWPNIDAVVWFCTEILPRLRERRPGLRFYIVGRSPAPAVRALASDAVVVTGTVPDVRPYLQHAGVVVAPLRVARGIQNKILEAMAMARPVVAARSCVEAFHVNEGEEVVSAVEAQDYLRAIEDLLSDPARARLIGAAGRHRVVQSHSWGAQLAAFDRQLEAALATGGAAGAGA